MNDKSFIAIQKAEIIRRAAEVSDEDSEWKSDEEKKPVAMAFFEDDDEYGGGAMVNDGEATSEGESGDENEAEGGPETALELAWLEDAQGIPSTPYLMRAFNFPGHSFRKGRKYP